MKKLLFCTSLVIIFGGCVRSYELTRPLSEKDSLQYLTKKADIIAVIQIFNGRDFYCEDTSLSSLPKSASAKVLSVLKGGKVPDIIEIDSSPHFSSKEGSIVVLFNRKYLAFLMDSGKTKAPLDAYSFMRIDDGRVSPIWTREPIPEVRRKNITLDQAIKDIQNELGKKEN